LASARSSLQDAIRYRQKLNTEGAPGTASLMELAKLYERLADVELLDVHFHQCRDAARRAAEVYEQLADIDPGNLQLQWQAAVARRQCWMIWLYSTPVYILVTVLCVGTVFFAIRFSWSGSLSWWVSVPLVVLAILQEWRLLRCNIRLLMRMLRLRQRQQEFSQGDDELEVSH